MSHGALKILKGTGGFLINNAEKMTAWAPSITALLGCSETTVASLTLSGIAAVGVVGALNGWV